MTESETRTRQTTRSLAGDYVTFTGYLRGLLAEYEYGPQLAIWALDEQRIMLYAGEWK